MNVAILQYAGEPQTGKLVPLIGAEDLRLSNRQSRLTCSPNPNLRSGTAFGGHVIDADNGEVAQRIWDGFLGIIDLMITDVIIPEMNGIDLAKRLIADHSNIRILFVSGHTPDVTIPEDFAGTRFGFLQKPHTSDVLNSKIKEILDS